MAGFAKRPRRRPAPSDTDKKFELPEDTEPENDSYITASYFDSEDDNDDLPDTRSYRKKHGRKTVVYEDDEFETKAKKPGIFKRMIHAIFPVKGDGIAESVRKIVFDVAVVAFIITGGSVLYDVIRERIDIDIVDPKVEEMYKDDENKTPEQIIGDLNLTDDEISAIEAAKPGIQPSFMELYNQNSDTVGWIRVGTADDPVISYAVVQAEDNDYYLTRNFLREETKRGAIFADYRNRFSPDGLSANTILYGHNMWTGDTMFAKLSRYYDGGVPKGESNDYLSFYKAHPTVTFNTLYENAEWKVFACVLFNTQEELGEVYPYINIRDFANADAFNTFVLDIMDRSVIYTDVDLTYGDEILTLSTCYYPYTKEKADTRVAVFARKVRSGENAEVDVSKAKRNPSPLKFTYQYTVEGGSWAGRSWDTSKLLSYNG